HSVLTGAVAVAALVFVVGGLAWAYHLIQQRGTQPASRPQQTPPVSQPTTADSGLQGEATGQQAPGPPAGSEPEPPLSVCRRVNEAIDRGVAHLRQDWCHPKEYQIYFGLLGLTLLECDVPRNDPAVGRIADLVRSQRNLDATHELSLAILFLDRLGDPKDAEV